MPIETVDISVVIDQEARKAHDLMPQSHAQKVNVEDIITRVQATIETLAQEDQTVENIRGLVGGTINLSLGVQLLMLEGEGKDLSVDQSILLMPAELVNAIKYELERIEKKYGSETYDKLFNETFYPKGMTQKELLRYKVYHRLIGSTPWPGVTEMDLPGEDNLVAFVKAQMEKLKTM